MGRHLEASVKLNRKFLNKSLDGPTLQAQSDNIEHLPAQRRARSPQFLSSLEVPCRSEDGFGKPLSSLARRSGSQLAARFSPWPRGPPRRRPPPARRRGVPPLSTPPASRPARMASTTPPTGGRRATTRRPTTAAAAPESRGPPTAPAPAAGAVVAAGAEEAEVARAR